MERPAGQAPVGDNDDYGVVGDNDGDVGDVVDAEGDGVDENDN